MRLRLLAFLPIAGVITFAILVSAASIVSALERSVVPPTAPEPPIRVSRFETECERLVRDLHELTHEASSCETQSACAASPLLCPVALDTNLDREFQRLRSALHARCDYSLGLLDYAWQGSAWEGGDWQGSTRQDKAWQSTARFDVADPASTDVADAGATHPEALTADHCGGRHDWLEAAVRGEATPTRFTF